MKSFAEVQIKEIKERRYLSALGLIGLCIAKHWYTEGDLIACRNLSALADSYVEIGDIYAIAVDIAQHSDLSDMERDYDNDNEIISYIMRMISDICHLEYKIIEE